MKMLTLARLWKIRACLPAIIDFTRKFNSKASISKVYYKLTHPEPEDTFGESYQDWLVWLLGKNKALTIALFEEGADISATDENGWTPLHWAARNNNTELAEFLIDQGANRNAVENTFHWTPLCVAKVHEIPEMIKFLKLKGG